MTPIRKDCEPTTRSPRAWASISTTPSSRCRPFPDGALTLLAVGCQIFVLALAPRTEDAFWSGLLAYHLSRVAYEAIVPSPFAATTVLLTGCLVYAVTRALDLRQTAGQRAPMRAATLAA